MNYNSYKYIRKSSIIEIQNKPAEKIYFLEICLHFLLNTVYYKHVNYCFILFYYYTLIEYNGRHVLIEYF